MLILKRLLLVILIFPCCALLMGGALVLASRVFPGAIDSAAEYIGLNILVSLISSIVLAIKVPLGTTEASSSSPEIPMSIQLNAHRGASAKINMTSSNMAAPHVAERIPNDQSILTPETYSWTYADEVTFPSFGLLLIGVIAYFVSEAAGSDTTTPKDWIYLILFSLIFGPMGVWCMGFRETHTVYPLQRQIVRTRSFLGIPLRRRCWAFSELSRVELGLGFGVKGTRYWSLMISVRSASGSILVRTYSVGAANAFDDARKLAQLLGIPFVERLK